MSRPQVLDRYFLEHRAKLLDIAAFLDRLDRAAPDARSKAPDHRLAAFLDGLKLLADGESDRTRRILELLSDPTSAPIPAAGVKGAAGADPAYRSQAAPIPDDEDLNLL